MTDVFWIAFISVQHRGFTTEKFLGVFSTKNAALDAVEHAARRSGSAATPTRVHKYKIDEGSFGAPFDWRNREKET